MGAVVGTQRTYEGYGADPDSAVIALVGSLMFNERMVFHVHQDQVRNTIIHYVCANNKNGTEERYRVSWFRANGIYCARVRLP